LFVWLYSPNRKALINVEYLYFDYFDQIFEILRTHDEDDDDDDERIPKRKHNALIAALDSS
jgi:hypothetical protein